MDKKCILYDDKICDDCGECNMCDLDPQKVCDNCGKCIEGFDYIGVKIDGILEDVEEQDKGTK